MKKDSLPELPEEFDYLTWKYRPLKDGLHDSGYRYMQITGWIRVRGQDPVQIPLYQWADHIAVEGSVNMDVEANGTMRIMPRIGGTKLKLLYDSSFGSDAMFKIV